MSSSLVLYVVNFLHPVSIIREGRYKPTPTFLRCMVTCIFSRNTVLREGRYFSQGTSQTRAVSIFLVSLVHPFTPHFRRFFPIMYFPKTWPSHPVPRRYSSFDLYSASSTYKTVALSPVWPNDACPVAKAKAATPTVQASYADS